MSKTGIEVTVTFALVHEDVQAVRDAFCRSEAEGWQALLDAFEGDESAWEQFYGKAVPAILGNTTKVRVCSDCEQEVRVDLLQSEKHRPFCKPDRSDRQLTLDAQITGTHDAIKRALRTFAWSLPANPDTREGSDAEGGSRYDFKLKLKGGAPPEEFHCDQCGGEVDRNRKHLAASESCDAYKAEREQLLATAPPEIRELASAISGLPEGARTLVTEALRVRGMDFVQERLMEDEWLADKAADVYRALVPDADKRLDFDPDRHVSEERTHRFEVDVVVVAPKNRQPTVGALETLVSTCMKGLGDDLNEYAETRGNLDAIKSARCLAVRLLRYGSEGLGTAKEVRPTAMRYRDRPRKPARESVDADDSAEAD